MAEKSPIARLNELGQSPWYDNVNREFVTGGELARMMSLDGLRGGTSNPTIFEKAIGSGDSYDRQLRRLGAEGRDARELYWELLGTDVDMAADALEPVFQEQQGGDGFVSIELDPDLARDTDGSVEQAEWLFSRLRRPNVMVKVPGTREGLPAVEELVARGRSVNVTLIFSLRRYDEVVEAYLRGLERLADAGGDLSRVASVASFFVSRVDAETDRRLPEGHELRGGAAVANAKLAYELFRRRFAGERWQLLESRGARVQRPLWASTSTKDPAYSDTLYVDELVGRDTVTTLADASVEALRDHGDPRADAVEDGVDEARALFDRLAEEGVDFDDVTRFLEEDGVKQFSASFHDALATIERKRAEVGA